MSGEFELRLGSVELKIKGWRGVVTLVGLGMLVAAILKELQLAPEQRTWHGTLLGLVPYDLRPPTPGRFARTFWNPDQSAIVVPTAFGVGWSVNAAGLLRALSGERSP